MNFQDLHELLRLELLRRIERGELTGTQLAQQTQFQQGHISNFLNKKRALSLEGLDRVLTAQSLSVEQILPIAIAASSAQPHDPDQVLLIPIVSASAAAEERQIHPASVIETLPVSSSRLLENLARSSRSAADWQRFVAIRIDGQQAAAMKPTLAIGSIAIIDRHYTSLAPFRSGSPTLYAIRYGGSLLLRYVEFEDGRLILRASAMDCPIQLIAVSPGEMPSQHIVGRVCMISCEV